MFFHRLNIRPPLGGLPSTERIRLIDDHGDGYFRHHRTFRLWISSNRGRQPGRATSDSLRSVAARSDASRFVDRRRRKAAAALRTPTLHCGSAPGLIRACARRQTPTPISPEKHSLAKEDRVMLMRLRRADRADFGVARLLDTPARRALRGPRYPPYSRRGRRDTCATSRSRSCSPRSAPARHSPPTFP